jgi:hypothetical protein
MLSLLKGEAKFETLLTVDPAATETVSAALPVLTLQVKVLALAEVTGELFTG